MNYQGYKLTGVLSEGLVSIECDRYGEQLWARAKCRKHKKCAITQEDLYKKEGYRPVGSQKGNRMDRIGIVGLSIIDRDHLLTQ